MQIPFIFILKKQNLHPKIRTAAEAQKIAYWTGIRKSRFLNTFSNSENEASRTRLNLHGFSPAFANLFRTVPSLSVSSFRSIGSDPEELEPRKVAGPVMQSLRSSSTSYFSLYGEIR